MQKGFWGKMTDFMKEMQEQTEKFIAPEVEAIRAALKSIEGKLDLRTSAARLVLDKSIISFEPKVLEIELTATEGKAKEKKAVSVQ